MAEDEVLTDRQRIDKAAEQIDAIMNPVAGDPLACIKGGELMNGLAEVLRTLGKL